MRGDKSRKCSGKLITSFQPIAIEDEVRWMVDNNEQVEEVQWKMNNIRKENEQELWVVDSDSDAMWRDDVRGWLMMAGCSVLTGRHGLVSVGGMRGVRRVRKHSSRILAAVARTLLVVPAYCHTHPQYNPAHDTLLSSTHKYLTLPSHRVRSSLRWCLAKTAFLLSAKYDTNYFLFWLLLLLCSTLIWLFCQPICAETSRFSKEHLYNQGQSSYLLHTTQRAVDNLVFNNTSLTSLMLV